MADSSVQFVKLVREVKEAILRAQESLEGAGVRIATVELEINTSLKTELHAGASFTALLPIDVSAGREDDSRQVINLTLRPTDALELLGSVQEDLANAIAVICSAANEAARATPAFEFESATAMIEVSYTSEGKLQVVGGVGAKKGRSHTIKLHLRKS